MRAWQFPVPRWQNHRALTTPAKERDVTPYIPTDFPQPPANPDVEPGPLPPEPAPWPPPTDPDTGMPPDDMPPDDPPGFDPAGMPEDDPPGDDF